MQRLQIGKVREHRKREGFGRRGLRTLTFLSGFWLGACFTDAGHGGKGEHGAKDGGEGGHGDHLHSLDTIAMPVELQGGAWTRDRLYARGKILFNGLCIQCHQEHGVGLPGLVPPLHESDFIQADRLRPIGILLNGLKGPIVVNGESYDGEMPPMQGSDLNTAAVLTYVRNHCNGTTDSIAPAEVAAAKR